MLSGFFENCYGIKKLDLKQIDFVSCNKSIIYAPNGVMKTSFAKVFEDISKGNSTCDRIFKNLPSSYSVKYYASKYSYSSSENKVVPTESIYVINSFADKFEFTKETVSTLLADESTRNEYDSIIGQIGSIIKEIEAQLNDFMGIPKPQIKKKILEDLSLGYSSDWPDVFNCIEKLDISKFDFIQGVKYTELFNDKTEAIYCNTDFKKNVIDYIESLDKLLTDNTLLNNQFSENKAEDMSKAFAGSCFFSAQHKIILKDGTQITDLEEWKTIVQEQLDKIYKEPTLAGIFEKLKKLFSKNAETKRVREVIIQNREIIPFMMDIPKFKKLLIGWYFTHLEKSFNEYNKTISIYSERIKSLYEKASEQSERWKEVVNEFNRRFDVPFKVKIINKSNFLLKDEAPNIEFEYSRGCGDSQESTDLDKETLMQTLSMGERRALYLLYILFDLERIRKKADEGAGKFLIIADDISDSFDYKNKYAIIEYLKDISMIKSIDLLILTHNYDFFRTILFRLRPKRENCLIAQKELDGEIRVKEFPYQKDFFKNVIISSISDGRINTSEKKKCLIASVSFYRNLYNYSGNEEGKNKLTCFLHYKTEPVNTSKATISDLWSNINNFINGVGLVSSDEPYIEMLSNTAIEIINDVDDVSLVNKLVLSVAARIEAEMFMKRVIIENEGVCCDAQENQTFEWMNRVKNYVSQKEWEILDEINLITPESIHLNSFMFEPLIDVSVWKLKELFKNSFNLNHRSN